MERLIKVRIFWNSIVDRGARREAEIEDDAPFRAVFGDDLQWRCSDRGWERIIRECPSGGSVFELCGQEGINNVWKAGSCKVVRRLRCERSDGVTVNRPSEGKKVSYYGIEIFFQVRLPNGNVQLRRDGNSVAKSVRERRFRAKKVTNNSSVRVVTRE